MLIAYCFALLCALFMLRRRGSRIAGSAALLASALGLIELCNRSTPRLLDVGIAVAWGVCTIAMGIDAYRLLKQMRAFRRDLHRRAV